MNTDATDLSRVMAQAVDACIAHVDAGGLPFVGVVVDSEGVVISGFGVNQAAATGDQMAHAEIVAMREAMARHGLDTLAGCALLATGEPCGLCYRYAINRDISLVYVAVNRDQVADLGFDYRASYAAFDVTDEKRAELFHPLAVQHGTQPFLHYFHLRHPDHLTLRPDAESKGTSS